MLVTATDGEVVEASMLQIVRDKPGGKIIALVKEANMPGEMTGRFLDGVIPPPTLKE